ncbi:MAG: hypothetical protein AAGN35_11510 [Bacteroidota bacterium]
MKLKSIVMLALLMPAVLFLTQGCNTCDQTGTIEFSATQQFLALNYIQDSTGTNFTDIWRPTQVTVLWNGEGGEGQFTPISEDITDGLIGPFPYTVEPQEAQLGLLYEYQYIIRKDTFGTDTVDIRFYPAVDECREFFSLIEYSINGEPQPGFEGSQTATIEIREN